jgi:hypothetical protein
MEAVDFFRIPNLSLFSLNCRFPTAKLSAKAGLFHLAR